MNAPCWITREETFGYPDDVLGRGRCLDTMPPGYHTAGLAPEHVDDPYGCVDCVYDWVDAMCEQDKGHEGPHEFIPAGSVVLAFPEDRA